MNGAERNKRYLFELKGGGAGFFDFDNDGRLDLFMVQGSTLERFRKGDNPHGTLYRNQGDGTFKDVTRKSGLTRTAWGMGVSFGDYDNDGFADVYLNNLGTNFLYRNRGDGTFEDVTEQAGVGGSGWTASSAFGDYDGDGDLDLFACNYIHYDFDNLQPPDPKLVCHYRGTTIPCGPLGLQAGSNRLYRNNGDGTFADVTVPSPDWTKTTTSILWAWSGPIWTVTETRISTWPTTAPPISSTSTRETAPSRKWDC